MLKVIMSLLGKDPSVIPDGAEIQFVWTHPPVSWRVFVVLGVLAGLWFVIGWLYRREAATCPRGVRILLAVLRSLVVLVAVLIFLGPALGISVRQTVEPSVLVLLDESLSMSVRDRYREKESLDAVVAFTKRTEADIRQNPPARVALVNELLQRDNGAFVRSLSTKGRVQILSFSESARLREAIGVRATEPGPGARGVERGGRVPPVEARGPGTNLGRALREALQSVQGNRIAALVLVSDGRDTVAEDPQEMAARFGQRGIPVFTVPVGDPSEACNVRVTEMWAPESVPQKDPFTIQAQVQARNVDRAQITVELRQSPGDAPDADPGTVVASQQLLLESGKTTYSVNFSHKPEQAGRFRFTVAVPVLAEEIVDTDNRRSAAVQVLDQKLRMLLVSGGPSWDYRLVRTLLLRDATVDVSCWLQSLGASLRQDGTTPIDHLPATAAELFVYDGILLMDPNPEEFTEQWLGLLNDFVSKHGGGLFWMAGPTYTAQSLMLTRGGGLREMLPVRWQDGPPLASAGQRSTWIRESPLRVRGAGADHPMLSLSTDARQNLALWGGMPGVFWYYPVSGAVPGAQVLIELADPALKIGEDGIPLLVEGQFGAGRVVWMGFSETWRWRRSGEEPFNRFWIQALRELAAGRNLHGKNRGQISTDRDRYSLGDTVRATVRLFDAGYRPLVAPLVKARVVAGGGETGQDIELLSVAGREGVYGGSFAARYLGPNEIQVALPEIGGASSERLARAFTVELPNVEFAEPQLNRGLLQLLATTSGGACLNLDRLADLPGRIPDRREALVMRSKPVEFWDTWRVLLLLVILLGIEWAVRKRYHLV
ncbi:MAG: hypothetical protein ACOYOU_07600 [Kiritimatiellia bacterium]